MTTKNFQAAKRPIVRGFLQALAEASYLFKTDPALDQKSLAKWMRTQDRATLENAYKSYAPRVSLPPYTE